MDLWPQLFLTNPGWNMCPRPSGSSTKPPAHLLHLSMSPTASDHLLAALCSRGGATQQLGSPQAAAASGGVCNKVTSLPLVPWGRGAPLLPYQAVCLYPLRLRSHSEHPHSPHPDSVAQGGSPTLSSNPVPPVLGLFTVEDRDRKSVGGWEACMGMDE